MDILSNVEIEKYLKADLFEELKMEALSPEERVAFLERIGEIVQQRVMLRLMQELSEDQKNRLESLLSQQPGDNASLGQFLKSEVPNIQQMVDEETAGYKKELIDKFNA